MERCCFTFDLRPGAEAEYELRHRTVWPELLAVLHEAGISNYTLFRRDLQVIAYCECEPDAATAFATVASSEVNARWSASFEHVIASLADERGELRWAAEVWHMSEPR